MGKKEEVLAVAEEAAAATKNGLAWVATFLVTALLFLGIAVLAGYRHYWLALGLLFVTALWLIANKREFGQFLLTGFLYLIVVGFFVLQHGCSQ